MASTAARMWLCCLLAARLLLLLLLLASTSSGTEMRTESTFRAAVYEHEVILPEDPKVVVSRAEALALMRRNLAVYETQAAEAKRQGADILVFPEDGLYGFRFTWDSIGPYMEEIPDPLIVNWVPCDDPARYPNTEVQQALSCLAKNNSLYLVANMGDRQPCHKGVDASCRVTSPASQGQGHFQYNTDVAFAPSGRLIAKYHKKNLFYESQFDTPVGETEVPFFDTPFGRWTMFTCFDILFYDPAVAVVEKAGIANVIFPTAWMDALPLLASVQFHSAFARGLGINFLAANIHRPQWRFQGSGIYTPLGMATFDHNATVGSAPRLLVGELDVLLRPRPPPLPASGVARLPRGPLQEEQSFLQPLLREEPKGSTETESAEQTETAFVASLFHDLFNFVQLDRPEGSLRTCSGKICCHLSYAIKVSAAGELSAGVDGTPQELDRVSPELFAFGAFDGLHTYEGQYYLQICALVRCANQSRGSCGQPTNQSSTGFQRLSLLGENFDSPQHVYPEVLLTSDTGHLRLAAAPEWSYAQLEIKSKKAFAYPLLSAALFGRVYTRDTAQDMALSRDEESSSSSSATSPATASSLGLTWWLFLALTRLVGW